MRSSKNRVSVVLVGHGSKAPRFDGAMKRVAARLRGGPFGDVRCAYLEINTPSIPQAIRSVCARGATEVRVLPYFLLAGNHVRKDIPQIVKDIRKELPRVRIKLCRYLDYDERIVSVVKERLRGR